MLTDKKSVSFDIFLGKDEFEYMKTDYLHPKCILIESFECQNMAPYFFIQYVRVLTELYRKNEINSRKSSRIFR